MFQDLMAAIMEFQAFLDEAVPKFRVEPDRSFISVWANATVKGCPMNDRTIMNETGLFISGGAETTRTAIARGLRVVLRPPGSVGAPQRRSVARPERGGGGAAVGVAPQPDVPHRRDR